jgi:hypothetical protein
MELSISGLFSSQWLFCRGLVVANVVDDKHRSYPFTNIWISFADFLKNLSTVDEPCPLSGHGALCGSYHFISSSIWGEPYFLS